jgi:endonuclease/exonuclease/phosphatase family metal-dependent hydrolase
MNVVAPALSQFCKEIILTEQFRIMTFNIRGSTADDGDNVWPARADLNVQTIRNYNPDLIGFQELQTGNLITYHQNLPGYMHILGVESSVMNQFQYNAIFWKLDRFEMQEFGSFYLSEKPDRWLRSWDTACVRAAVWARLRSNQTGASLLYLNTHLDHISEPARQEGTKLILRRLNDLRSENNLPTIVTADFNARAWMPDEQREGDVHRLYSQAGYKDAYLEVGNAPNNGVNTFHGFEGTQFEAQATHLRIDWILTLDGVRRFEVDSCQIVFDEQPPLYPSDHYPVIADLRLS